MNILRKALIIVAFTCGCKGMFAQSLPNFDIIKLEQAPDYKKAEPFVLQTVTYLLSSPLQKDNADRMKSLQFIGKWMSGTPDYAFRFDDAGGKVVKGNNDLVGIYMAAMVKYSLENKAAAKDTRLMKLNAMTLLLNYCENKNNNVRMNKQLKKLSEAKEKGELEQALTGADTPAGRS